MLEDLREIYGAVYVTSLPDGLDVPWKPLSYGDFIYFTDLMHEGRISSSVIEDEIFRKAVVNKALVDRIYYQKAGTISVVVQHIMEVSGPKTIEEFNSKLIEVRSLKDNPLHKIVTIVCRAFPAYTPETVYALDYETMIFRLAQAEELLLQAGLIAEPVSLEKKEELPAKKEKPVPIELKHAWEQYDKKFRNLNPETPSPAPPVKPITTTSKPQTKPGDASPPGKYVEDAAFKKRVKIKELLYETIDTKNADFLTDDERMRQKMLQETPLVYRQLIKKLHKEALEKKK